MLTRRGTRGRLARCTPLAHFVRKNATPIRVNAQLPLKRRDGALVTLLALANTAGNTDRFKSSVRTDVEPVGKDEVWRVFDLAPERNRVAAHRRAKPAPCFGYVARKADITYPEIGRAHV